MSLIANMEPHKLTSFSVSLSLLTAMSCTRLASKLVGHSEWMKRSCRALHGDVPKHALFEWG